MAEPTPVWHDLGPVEDLKSPPLRQLVIGRTRIALSWGDGGFGAISGACNHAGGPLGEGRLDGDYITCPWHNWKYHRARGEGEPGYEDESVPRHEVKVEGGDVPRFQPLGSSSEQVGEGIKNVFDDLPQHLPKELVQILVRAADVRIERIISHGHASPSDFWYDQAQHERVIVLKGAAKLQFDDGMVEMKPGDFINIPAFRKHRVDWTTPDEPTVWLGVRYS